MGNEPSTNMALFYAVFCFVLFLAVSFDIKKEVRLRRRAKKWRGEVMGVITEIKEDFRYRKLFHKEWYEYPVLAFTVEHVSYRLPYPRKKEGIGYYEMGQSIPLLYNQDNPNEFAFSGEFSGFFYYLGQFFSLVFSIACLGLFLFNFKQYYLGTHELLFEQETWTELETSFSSYEGRDSFDYFGELRHDTEEAIEHFQRLDRMIEKKQGWKNYDAYRGQYLQSATVVSRSLGDAFSGLVGTFYEECGLEGEKETIYQSAYADFLREVSPSAFNEPGRYSLEELFFLADMADFYVLREKIYREDPEESIGLSLAVCNIKIEAAMDMFGFRDPVKETMDKWFDKYIVLYMDRVDEYLLDYEEPPLNRNAVDSVYKYVIEIYHSTGSFQKALWNGSIFAQNQAVSRLEEQPYLRTVKRYADENNPLSAFRPEQGMEVFLTSTNSESARTPKYYLDNWEYFIETIDKEQRLSFWMILPL